MEFPGLGVELELQLQAYTTAVETLDSSCSLWQSHLNSLSRAGDQIHVLMDSRSGSQPAEPRQELLQGKFQGAGGCSEPQHLFFLLDNSKLLEII